MKPKSIRLLKNNKKIAIRCITLPSKGYGNFNRCLNLAKNLKKFQYEISFVIDTNKLISTILKKEKFNFISIPVDKSFSQKTNFFIDYLKKNPSNFSIIDMREYGEQTSKALFKNKLKTILLDDAWCKKVYSDILFNGTNVVEYHDYKKINKNSKIFVGPKYWIIDKNFKIFSKKSNSIKSQKFLSIVISMGGSDPLNLTEKILKSILNINQIKILVVMGPFFSYEKRIQKIVKNHQNVLLKKSPKNMWSIFSNSDIVISNGGNTLFELACMGIPTLCIPSVKHEIKYTENFSSKNFSINLSLRQQNPLKIKNSLIRIINDQKIQKQMCSAGKKIVDGNGLLRVIKIIKEFT